MTITASTNLTDAEIDRAVKEAEQFAEEDKKRKEEVETRNHADQLVYTTEKTVKELGDKLTEDDKAKINAEVEALKAALAKTDTAAIKAASEQLTTVSYEIFGKIYQQAGANANPNGGDPNAGGGYSDPNAGGYTEPDGQQSDGSVNTDYEVH